VDATVDDTADERPATARAVWTGDLEERLGEVLDPEMCREVLEQALERANMILKADARSRAALRRRAAAPGAPRRSREVRRGRAARPGRRRRSSVSRDDGGSDSSDSDGPTWRAETRRTGARS